MEAELELLAEERSQMISREKKVKGELRYRVDNVLRGSNKTRELKSEGTDSKSGNGGCYER